jgi:hypothetical protein
VVREGVGQGGEMTQALNVHMNKKKKNPPLQPDVSLLQLAVDFSPDIRYGTLHSTLQVYG